MISGEHPSQLDGKPQECQNTDKEIWRSVPGDFYSPSIHVTASGAIGINVGGSVFVRPVERWHQAVAIVDGKKETFSRTLHQEANVLEGKAAMKLGNRQEFHRLADLARSLRTAANYLAGIQGR